MIVYSRNIGRHVPLRDLPASELIELAEAYGTYEPRNESERTEAHYGVASVWAELMNRRDLPRSDIPWWASWSGKPERKPNPCSHPRWFEGPQHACPDCGEPTPF